MSRIGKKPIELPGGVTVDLGESSVTIKGSKGTLEGPLLDEVITKVEDNRIVVKSASSSKRSRSRWGLQRTLLSNMVTGVSEGFTVGLEINGVGYRAAVKGKDLQLQLGYSHDINYPIPEGIEIKCPRPTEIIVSGIDKQRVGQVASDIREYRKPEPYKGKGVKYVDEYIFRKEGKKK